MTAALTILLALSGAPLLDLETIPVESGYAHVFIAHADADDTADVFILEGNRLSWFSGAASYPQRTLTFEKGTSAFDVADIDADGQPELVAINGRKVVRYDLTGAAPGPEPSLLFEADSLFAREGGSPFPHVLLAGNPEVLVLLPEEKAIAAHRIDGTQAASYEFDDIGADDPPPLTTPSSFMAMPVNPPQAAPGSAIEMRINLVSQYDVALPDELKSGGPLAPEYRRGTPSQVRDAANVAPSRWPWFPIRLDKPESLCALYAATDSMIIRVRSYAPAPDRPGDKYQIGPPRRYPGLIVLPQDDLPDFNGDGHVDLLLWSSPDPGASIDSFTRAALDGRWPLRLAVYLFSPAKGRFEPRADSVIECKIPVGWFLRLEAGAPMRNCVLRDLDGDGRTDCAFSTAPAEFSVWRYDDGFSAEPAERHTFGESIDRVEFKADLSGRGCTTVALRSASALHVLYAAK